MATLLISSKCCLGLVAVVMTKAWRQNLFARKCQRLLLIWCAFGALSSKPLLELSECAHATVIKDMCAGCGADLRQDDNGNQSEASVPMVHAVPELKVTQKLAQELGKADTERLLTDHKLVFLVDLDQTLIHTTNDNVPNNHRGVYHFQLYGPNSPWYHTRLRPGTFDFLKNMAPFFELHICTFGARNYAHTIAQFLDEDGKYFSQRILSRDECFNVTSKTDNLRWGLKRTMSDERSQNGFLSELYSRAATQWFASSTIERMCGIWHRIWFKSNRTIFSNIPVI